MTLVGKVAFVTGASQGLGKAFSEILLRKGAKVCLVDLQKKKGETTAAEFQQEFGKDKAVFLKCDVTSPTEFQKALSTMIETFGRLDIMVNNAGIMDENEPIRMINVNLTGVVLGTSMAVELMSKEKGGHGGLIINVASTAGLTPKAFVAPVYTGTKYGVAGFTRCWSYNPYLRKMGLQFACLCPAFTRTDILDFSKSLYPSDGNKLVEALGINEVSAVAAGFLQLVEDDQCNGAVMTVTAKDGIQYNKKPFSKM